MGANLDVSPLSTPGPSINNHATTVTLLSHSQLSTSEFLPLLPPLFNPAFSASHGESGVLPAEIKRLPSDTQILQELAPDSCTYLVYAKPASSATAPPVLYACASFQPYTGEFPPEMPEAAKKFVDRPLPLPEGTIAWSIKLLVVELQVQKRGIGSSLYSLLETEVLKRASRIIEARAANGKPPVKEVQLKLSTIKEINQGFWIKKGYTVVGEKKHPSGTYGSKTGFTTSDMVKVLQ